MELEFKQNFEECRKNWDRFWAGNNERPMIRAVIPKPGVEPIKHPHPYFCASCTKHDLNKIIDTLGKGAIRSAAKENIPEIWRQSKSKHLYISTNVTSEEEMKKIMDECTSK